MQEVPKVELHLHLGGSYPITYLESIAEGEDCAKLKGFLDLMELKSDATDYHACFQAFGLVNKIINSYQKVQDGAYIAVWRQWSAAHIFRKKTGTVVS